ncbi:MAG: phosphoribosylamine--glycine ligase [Candidatus Saganbacteria bacterium]|uniref:Phosphoribosylamine--glycine ligase n=1 Tax=Candidatus Saganbacteria bacterium TaxID=2575572 RepID=A0A833NYX2_UNCSA|nr:MAG: phosphoribosylamine--glycine ligase [Candidatus Saganbacteria bacterium]
MKILVIGSGGREHTLVWKLAQSPKASKIYCAPGNAGIAQIAENINICADNIPALRDFALKNKIDITVVGPEVPLTLGIVDEFEAQGLKIFGPSKKGALIEGSKIFAKNLMKKYNIPTADFATFTDYEKAIQYIKKIGAPVVIKADGLAAGKGVIICKNETEANDAIKRILKDREFGNAGNEIVIEECLVGEEASLLCFTDGKTIISMASAQDHKRINDFDEGPNTGGMGAYSPAPILTADLLKIVEKEILQPTIKGMEAEGHYYKGILYVGLMITKNGPKVLEYNARFGDPETQCIIPRLKTDLLEIILKTIDCKLNNMALEWDNRPAVCVVLSAGGYPGSYKKGEEIEGLDNARELDDVIIFHAGTAEKDGKIITSGGRVLGVVGLGETIRHAIDRSYMAVKLINFKDMHYRKDIGEKALNYK